WLLKPQNQWKRHAVLEFGRLNRNYRRCPEPHRIFLPRVSQGRFRGWLTVVCRLQPVQYRQAYSAEYRRSQGHQSWKLVRQRILDAGQAQRRALIAFGPALEDRQSTRLNSSHVSTSYAVFRLQKKKTLTTY